ncbi:MAG: T9SS type A sorting domain-containing protein [Bacteroidales bacterium]|nr:T9SS type A sorting domain-containing protein [Bacteroidales bacterium]
MKRILSASVLLLISTLIFAQTETKGIHGPTDTLLLHQYEALMGNPSILTYSYSNGNGYFFGTNFIDIDQDPLTPYENGVQAFGQGFPVDTGMSFYILDILVKVGNKVKDANSTGTPLILSVQYLDDSSTYNVNTSSGSQSYTVHAPGTSLGSASISWDNIYTGLTNQFSVAHFNTPLLIEKNFVVVVDLMDFYLNGDRIGFWVSPPNGGSNIYGLEYTLWLYPNPMLWLQVNHIFSNVNRAIAIFPVIDDGTFGIDDDAFLNGLKLGQSFPNPATTSTTILYELETSSVVQLELTDINGNTVYSENFGNKPTGIHQQIVPLEHLASGTYFYTLFANNKTLTKKLVVSK